MLVATAVIVGQFVDGRFVIQNSPEGPASLLSGGAGNDTLQASGPDTVVGGTGTDTFVARLKDPAPGGSINIEQLLEDEQGLELAGIERFQVSFGQDDSISSRFLNVVTRFP
jgi:hypothetical protein